jgi:hypothetical protein
MLTNPAIRRYNVRVLVLSVVYAVLLFAMLYLLRRGALHGPIAYLAVLPAFPLIGTFLALGRYIVEETDEYLRMLMVRQALIATGILLSITTAWGFIEIVGLVPHLPAYFTAVFWFGGLWIGWGFNIATMRRPV